MTRDEHHRRTDRYRGMLAQASTQFGGRVLSVDQDIAILLFANPEEAVRAGLWGREIFADVSDEVGDVQARMSIHVEAAIATQGSNRPSRRTPAWRSAGQRIRARSLCPSPPRSRWPGIFLSASPW